MSSSLHTSSVSSLFLFSHSRFSSNSTGFTDTDPRCIFLSSGIYVCVYVCASRRIRHTEDTRIQAEQIKRRLPGIIRSVARRGARTNQAASLFPASELAFLFFPPPPLSFFSFLFFLRSPFLFFFFATPRSRCSTTIGATVRERRRGISRPSWVGSG